MHSKKTLGAGAVLVLATVLGSARPAHAQWMTMQAGPMKNLIVDVVFLGPFCPIGVSLCQQQQDVLDYINDFSAFLRGAPSPSGTFSIPGHEAAAHYYGVSDLVLGSFVVGPTDPNAYGSNPGLDQFKSLVNDARNGNYYYAHGSDGTLQWGIPQGQNRITLVVTLGLSSFDIYGPAVGFHDDGDRLFAAAQWEDHANLSHELLEAMTDPGIVAPIVITPPSGWNNGNATEIADPCVNAEDAAPLGRIFHWTGTNTASGQADDISGLASVVVDPAFLLSNSPQMGCQVVIPEQHAPMAATFEYGGNGQTPLALFYVTPSGHINELWWGAAGQSASGPYDLGQPSAGVSAAGKPSVVYSLQFGGERLFVKGSDGAVWMHTNGAWTSLGAPPNGAGLVKSQIFGDPQAVLWNLNNTPVLDVFALGTDENLWGYGMTSSAQWGWGATSNTGGTQFVGSPTVISRAANSVDMFAVGEDGNLKWMQYSSGGWASPVTFSINGTPVYALWPYSSVTVNPFLAPPGVASQGPGQLDIFGTAQSGLFHSGCSNGSCSALSGSNWQLPASPQQQYGIQGTPAVISSAPGRTDVFAVSRYGELWWWYSTQTSNGYTWQDGAGGTGSSNPLPLVASGVSGDPVVVSRWPGEMEVFYRVANGSLAHMTYNNGTWAPTEYVLSPMIPSTIQYDPLPNRPSTQCTAVQRNTSVTMHCCPTGSAMVGIDVGNDVLKCVRLGGSTGTVQLDTGTQRNNMHACPLGSVMVGFRNDMGDLACVALPPNAFVNERVDTGTQDPKPLHACDPMWSTAAMSGINVSQNYFTCATISQIQ